jgi:hypothetical protein
LYLIHIKNPPGHETGRPFVPIRRKTIRRLSTWTHRALLETEIIKREMIDSDDANSAVSYDVKEAAEGLRQRTRSR